MAESPNRPVLNPVLRFTKEPVPASITGGGKNEFGVKNDRLLIQRGVLSQQFIEMSEQVDKRPKFNGRTVIYAEMFDDSFAPSWEPSDLFKSDRGANLVVPYDAGYLVEMETDQLDYYAKLIQSTAHVNDRVDISRVASLGFFESNNVTKGRSFDDLWKAAPETPEGRIFLIWLMPFHNNGAAEALIKLFTGLREKVFKNPKPLLRDILSNPDSRKTSDIHRSLLAAAGDGDRINMALREYRRSHRSRTTVVVSSKENLLKLVASGAIFRIDPVPILSTTAPGEGREPDRLLPKNISTLPIVGVIDGGLTAQSYMPAVAWTAPAYVRNVEADARHGNQVTSLIVQGHEWNNNLGLPQLHCRVGIVQAIARPGALEPQDLQEFMAYLDAVMATYPTTRVWNMSFNAGNSCDSDAVSSLGHDIAMLARKYNILPVISIGNLPGDRLKPPADCEAALTVGGRLHDENGAPAEDICPVSHSGPGPSCMLKPEISHFSHVRALGGALIKGSSFSTALSAPLAAHTMAKLKEPLPDMVKALLIHNSDRDHFHASHGFGTPDAEAMPWQCRDGFVTLQWTASLRPGASFYWELPIPHSLRKTGKLKGRGILTAVLNPHPMIDEYAGPNYFSVRLATALQYEHGVKETGEPNFKNLLGGLGTEAIAEQQARTIEHKWSPVRHHKKSFPRGIKFDGDNLRVYARIFTRDDYQFENANIVKNPEMKVSFVLTLGTGNSDDHIYDELRTMLGSFVENATIEQDIEIDHDEV